MKKPYIKKLRTISHFKVYIVDGMYIRNHIDIEFTNFGQHFRHTYIPKDEFWIDKEYGTKEEKYFVKHLMMENKLMSDGKTYEEALTITNKKMIKLRQKSPIVKEILTQTLSEKEIIDEHIHLRRLKGYGRKMHVWIVNGELVRSLYFIDFVQGGNDKAYTFVPKNEIWIDDDLNPKERKYVILHEIHERNLMKKGWIYAFNDPRVCSNKIILKSAHDSASHIEVISRTKPKKLNRVIYREIKKFVKE